MSTYFYLECLDHEPPLLSSDEVSQHDDEYVQDALRLARGEPPQVRDDRWRTATYFREHAEDFLRQHKGCRLDVVSEYGEHIALDGTRSWDQPSKEVRGGAA